MNQKTKYRNLLPPIAIDVVIAAAAVTLIPKNTENKDVPASESQSSGSTFSASSGDFLIQTGDIGMEELFIPEDIDGKAAFLYQWDDLFWM